MTRETDEQLAQSKVEDLKYRVKIRMKFLLILAVSIHQNSYHEEKCFRCAGLLLSDIDGRRKGCRDNTRRFTKGKSG